MNMSNRQRLVGWGAVVILAILALSIWVMQRRRDDASRTPAWTDPGQPPVGVANTPTQLTADQSWAANRCAPFAASCADNTAGMRVRRRYPDTLADSECSIVRGSIALGGGIG